MNEDKYKEFILLITDFKFKKMMKEKSEIEELISFEKLKECMAVLKIDRHCKGGSMGKQHRRGQKERVGAHGGEGNNHEADNHKEP
jgi:hypothetical protein